MRETYHRLLTGETSPLPALASEEALLLTVAGVARDALSTLIPPGPTGYTMTTRSMRPLSESRLGRALSHVSTLGAALKWGDVEVSDLHADTSEADALHADVALIHDALLLVPGYSPQALLVMDLGSRIHRVEVALARVPEDVVRPFEVRDDLHISWQSVHNYMASGVLRTVPRFGQRMILRTDYTWLKRTIQTGAAYAWANRRRLGEIAARAATNEEA